MLPCEPARVYIKLARLLVTYHADLPMSVVNCCLIFVEGSTDKAVRAPRSAKFVLGLVELARYRFARWSRRFWSRWCCLASSSAP